jgi:riboflavin synthase
VAIVEIYKMFTGIVEMIGKIIEVEDGDDGRRIWIEMKGVEGFENGVSICVSGVCLTVETHENDKFSAFLSRETLMCSNLRYLKKNSTINLERAIKVDGRLDGHIVQGHVDTVAKVIGINKIGGDWEYEFELPEKFDRYMVKKGSITVDGVSLTIADIDNDKFSVAIIPATYSNTTLNRLKIGEMTNIEVDILAKYAEKLLKQ